MFVCLRLMALKLVCRRLVRISCFSKIHLRPNCYLLALSVSRREGRPLSAAHGGCAPAFVVEKLWPKALRSHEVDRVRNNQVVARAPTRRRLKRAPLGTSAPSDRQVAPQSGARRALANGGRMLSSRRSAAQKPTIDHSDWLQMSLEGAKERVRVAFSGSCE